MENLGSPIQLLAGAGDYKTVLPAGKRRYINVTNLSLEDLTAAFKNAKILD